MVTSKELHTRYQFSAWNSPVSTSDRMALLQAAQNCSWLHCPPHLSTFSVDEAFQARSVSDLADLNLVHLNGVDGFFKQLHSSSPSLNRHLKNSQCAISCGLAFNASTTDASQTCQKRFLVVDQSENHTRLLFNPFLSPQNYIVSSKSPPGIRALPSEELAVQVEKESLMKPVVQEKWDENHLTDEGSEMHEDTEEINALLYSDSDDEYDENNADGENDEVTSKVHTSFGNEKGYNMDKQSEELIEEIASSDGTTKRQRLLNGGYRISSLLVDRSPVELVTSCNCNYKDDAESSVAPQMKSSDDSDPLKKGEKVNIHETLKILKSIIPGLKSTDPLLIIDKAIIYLQSMKLKAKALEVSHPQVVNSTVG